MPQAKEKVPPGDKQHSQFGNNFFLVFEAMHLREQDPGHKNSLLRSYLAHAEGLGEPWQLFLDRNAELVNEIDEAVSGLEPYKLLSRRYRDLLREGRFDQAEALDTQSDIEGIGIEAWNRLNPLLERAAAAMEEVGIDPKQFYA